VTDIGARIAGDLLSLAAIEAEFSRFRIRVRCNARWPQGDSLFEKVLGPAIEDLPPRIRDVHTRAPLHLMGRATIDGAHHWTGRLIARLFGFPGSRADEEAAVLLKRRGEQEIWIRRFGNSTFRSFLSPGPSGGRLLERFGPFRFDLEVTADGSGFELAAVGWRVGPLRLPSRLAPRTPARAYVDHEGRYRFDVTIILPFVGQLVRYRGWLLPEEEATVRPSTSS
jgi:hypothetical protein